MEDPHLVIPVKLVGEFVRNFTVTVKLVPRKLEAREKQGGKWVNE